MDPRIIKTDADYRRAKEEAEKLIALDPDPSTDEGERLDLLSLLIETYESERFRIERPNPFEAIKFRMEEQGLRQRDLIPFIGSKSKVSEVLTGKRPLTVPMIRALREGLGIPADVLLQEPQPEDNCDTSIAWDKFPVKEMVKRRWLAAAEDELNRNWRKLVERFFEPLGGMQSLQAVCRRTLVERSGKSMDKYALWAWTARVLIKANSMKLPSYKTDTVNKEFIEQVLRLSLSHTGPLDAQRHLRQHGICLIIEPHLPRTHLDGAALLSKEGRPVIGLAIRHDRIDNFWFTLAHELVHVEKHLTSADEAFVDDLDSEPGADAREREADRIASEAIIPRAIWKRSDAYRRRTPDAVQELALQLRLHPAIIAGRIRHDTRNFYILSQMVGTGQVRKLFLDINWS
ncbi:MAG: ImmA/IrrE family metallo-endopeptidase [Syntrophorhabdales bacterium]|jgi:HTH-type transcriptional regulator/antitoxin HigA